MLSEKQLRQLEMQSRLFLEEDDYHLFLEKKGITPLQIAKISSCLPDKLIVDKSTDIVSKNADFAHQGLEHITSRDTSTPEGCRVLSNLHTAGTAHSAENAQGIQVRIEYSNPLNILLIATYAWLKIRLDRFSHRLLPESQTLFSFNGSNIHGPYEEQEIVALTLAMVMPCDVFLEDIETKGGIDYEELEQTYAVDRAAIRMRIINLQVLGEIS